MKLTASVALSALLLLSACDNKNSASSVVGALTGNSLPSDIAALISPNDTLWLDFPYRNTGCGHTPDDYSRANLYYKPDSEPWPPMQSDNAISSEHALPWLFDTTTYNQLRDMFAAQLVAGGFILINAGKDGFDQPIFCMQLVEGKIGASYNNYRDNATGAETRGLVRVGTVALDSAQLISEFQKMRPEGYETKHRKYHLVAVMQENPLIGTARLKFVRDVVVFFNVENNAWEIDRYDQTPWTLANGFVAAATAALHSSSTTYDSPQSKVPAPAPSAEAARPGFIGTESIGSWTLQCDSGAPVISNDAFGRCRVSLAYRSKDDPKQVVMVIAMRLIGPQQHLAVIVVLPPIVKKGDELNLQAGSKSLKIPVNECERGTRCVGLVAMGSNGETELLSARYATLFFPPDATGKRSGVAVPFGDLPRAVATMRRAEPSAAATEQ